MHIKPLTAHLLTIALLGSSPCLAQSQKTPNTLALDTPDQWVTADLAQFDWLNGRWLGEGLGGECEEVYLPVLGDSKIGTFRLVKEGKLVFSEFFALVTGEGGTVLKLKHFHPDMTGWEEKDKSVTFRLVKLDDRAAYFDGLTYQLADDGTLRVYVAMRNPQTDALSEVPFVFQRVGL